MDEENPIQVKVGLLGESGVGKTNKKYKFRKRFFQLIIYNEIIFKFGLLNKYNE